jgi:CDP-2,3-bis-(O-geranylgeranyl)-sn-glycerol synthase
VRVVWPLLRALYLFSPLLLSIALSAIVQRFDLVRALKVPIDGGATFRGKRLFGKSKTWRGVAVAVVGSVVMAALQKWALRTHFASVAVVDYGAIDPLLFGAVMGASAMAGELPNSFVKRQLGIEPGHSASTPVRRVVFWIWDQVDLLTLSWPSLTAWVAPSRDLVVASFALALVIHPSLAWFGYVIGARSSAR